jgi:ubiquinone/menaquinone biosynthesis C-methylase UbiE
MQRADLPEILDSEACSPSEAHAVLRVIGRVNRWFGGLATTQKMVEAAARHAGKNRLSMLEVAAGLGEIPGIVRKNLSRRGITLDVTLLDLARTHLPQGNRSVVGNALALPFADKSFDLISCNLFVHHLQPRQVHQFAREALRVSRVGVLINDLVRHPLHVALAFAGYPLMLNRVAWLDGVTSVRRAYTPQEIRQMIGDALSDDAKPPRVEILHHYLYRMGITVWKTCEN